MKNIVKFLSCGLVAVFCQVSVASAANAGGDVAKPVMVIRFNQQFVHFQEPLKKVVSEVGDAKANANYEVQSIVPSAVQKNNVPSEIKKSEMNLNSVLLELKKLHVEQSAVNSSTVYSDDVQTQEVKIFVK